MTETLLHVRTIAAEISGIKVERLTDATAVDQDMDISGQDVTDFAEALADAFGEDVWNWPWQRFALLEEGLSLLFPFMLFWQLLTWPVRGRFSYPSPYERLELGHIAKVVDAGHWIEP